MKTLLAIAGYDPSGGAGALLDVRVFATFGFHGAAVLTALTFQNTLEVRGVAPVPPRSVTAQYNALSRDMDLAGIKVGMLGSRAVVPTVGRILAAHAGRPRVVDPVLRSSSGAVLLEGSAVPAFFRAVGGNATVLTPNLGEASVLSGRAVATVAEMREAALIIHARTGVPCLVKGGHLARSAVNVLYDGRRTSVFGHEKLSRDVHGTGCLLSSAILAYLALGRSLEKACGLAADMVHEAILRSVRPGRGRRVFRFPPRDRS